MTISHIMLIHVQVNQIAAIRLVKTRLILSPGLATTTAQCQAGYYCAGRADRQDPTDGVMGNICPPGRYCGKLSFPIKSHVQWTSLRRHSSFLLSDFQEY